MSKGEELIRELQVFVRENAYRRLREPFIVQGPLPDKLPQFPHIIPERKEPER